MSSKNKSRASWSAKLFGAIALPPIYVKLAIDRLGGVFDVPKMLDTAAKDLIIVMKDVTANITLDPSHPEDVFTTTFSVEVPFSALKNSKLPESISNFPAIASDAINTEVWLATGLMALGAASYVAYKWYYSLQKPSRVHDLSEIKIETPLAETRIDMPDYQTTSRRY